MVEIVGLKLVTHHPVIEPLSAAAPGTEGLVNRLRTSGEQSLRHRS
jgi:hypothetical protein